ncbi:bifunctional adenosylcobinamide kinase/adenosylcobinamide-phosphate guanylyltransferase [Cochlodiniinecator piscidefendens]|uniref:bifunctional adenosylcobinamide kinase/adenosylcobinamide-phosphate guanylyltransferase n=1 Tax=Cochlodiniinecator piscidefendens TaxID=2715756 RepID=UPI00140A042A|nr:bifunctional adenosylcobinamide kinase/adenosylcobinamide-phosphate guanylyltransferase [Cochlodiniinecator piscidefendens]
MLPSLSLVIGGAASGKSRYAEELVIATERPRVYIATAQVYDDEMQAKVDKHLVQRGPDWRTIEAPFDLTDALQSASAREVVLLDCATLWLTNHLLAEHDLRAQEAHLMAALTTCAAPVVIVSNEVGAGIVPENALSRRFREAQGGLNQRLAATADLVVTVMAGLPLVLKGALK